MGGLGSGAHYYHWWRPRKKTVVEECRALDANRWMREKVLAPGVHLSGGWTWRNATTGEQTSAIGYEVCTREMAEPWVRLHYTFTRDGQAVDYRVRLTTTRPRFGGLRWWFVCPLIVGGRPCERRVGKLYLPPGARYYGCRRCYGLTYKSCQEHDGRVSALRRNPELLADLLDNPEAASVGQLILALKAIGP
jgi:hypothetical protein